MSEKLNNLFGTTRMMLFEHRDELIERGKRKQRELPPQLDEQKREELDVRLLQAFREQTEIGLVLFHPLRKETIRGLISAVDTTRKGVKINGEWVKAEAIIDIT